MTAFEAYIASGGQRPGLWRVLVGVVLITGLWVGGTMAVVFAWGVFSVVRHGGEAARERLSGLTTGGDPAAIAVMLMTFAGIWLGVFLTVRLLHGQRFATLFAPDGRVRAGDLGKGLLVASAFGAASLLAALAVAEPASTALPLGRWAAFALVVTALVFVQATAEELMFRGYLLQQLALRSRNPLVWAVLPSALFGALHWANAPTGEMAAYYVAATFLIGLALAALVWKTGSLWAAIGLHVGTNVMGLTVVGAEGIFSGTQLYLFPDEDLLALMRIDLGLTVLLLAFILSPWSPFGPPRARRAA